MTTLNIIEGNLEEIEKYTFNRELYSGGYPQPLFQVKDDHFGNDRMCWMCTGSCEKVFEFVKIRRDLSQIVNRQISVEGKQI